MDEAITEAHQCTRSFHMNRNTFFFIVWLQVGFMANRRKCWWYAENRACWFPGNLGKESNASKDPYTASPTI